MDMNHQMELLSIAMTTAVCATAGCNWSFRMRDFGIDLHIHGENWLVQPQIDAQLKSIKVCSAPRFNHTSFRFKLKLKNYNDLRKQTLRPQLLLVVLLPEDPNLWLIDDFDQISFNYGIYWTNLRGMPPTTNQYTVTVDIPLRNRFNTYSLRSIMAQVAKFGALKK